MAAISSKKETRVCKIHGETLFAVREYARSNRKGTYKVNLCLKCENAKQKYLRSEFKNSLLEYYGSFQCEECGYSRYPNLLNFHHINTKIKKFNIGHINLKSNFEKVKAELEFCQLLCSNCHAEKHSPNLSLHQGGKWTFYDFPHMNSFISKQIFIDNMNHKCLICEDNDLRHLSFHHLYPKNYRGDANLAKKYSVCNLFFKRKFDVVKNELRKTVCLCHNCHIEIERSREDSCKDMINSWIAEYPYPDLTQEMFKALYEKYYNQLVNSGKIRFTSEKDQNRLKKIISKQETYSKKLIKDDKEYFCIDCSKKVKYKTKRCLKCSRLDSRIVKRPSYKKLKEEISQSTFVAVGKKYNVSDNAVRKWLKQYEKDNKSPEDY